MGLPHRPLFLEKILIKETTPQINLYTDTKGLLRVIHYVTILK